MNACVIKERILLVTVGIALARMQEVIEVNILILLNGIQTAYYIDNICSIVYEFFRFERVILGIWYQNMPITIYFRFIQ